MVNYFIAFPSGGGQGIKQATPTTTPSAKPVTTMPPSKGTAGKKLFFKHRYSIFRSGCGGGSSNPKPLLPSTLIFKNFCRTLKRS